MAAPRRGACTRGVSPSPRVNGGVASLTGRNRRYRSISRGRALAAVMTGSVIDGIEGHVDPARQDGIEGFLRLGQRHDLAADGGAVLEADGGGLVERGRQGSLLDRGQERE